VNPHSPSPELSRYLLDLAHRPLLLSRLEAIVSPRMPPLALCATRSGPGRAARYRDARRAATDAGDPGSHDEASRCSPDSRAAHAAVIAA
jgi:hypothetical protein